MREIDKKEVVLEESFKAVVAEGIDSALAKIEKNYEQGSPEERFPFHNKAHTESVVRRTALILEAARTSDPALVTLRDVELARLIAAYHDVVQNWAEKEEVHPQFGKKLVRHRFAIENETDSVDALIVFMERANLNSAQGNLFSQEDMAIAKEAIMATIPDYDAESGTAVQPHLNERSSIIAKALALADLGVAGMDGPEAYLSEGDALFRENNLDITRALEENAELDPVTRENYRQRMIKWTQNQCGFAEGRKSRLSRELEGLSDKTQTELEKLFVNFDPTIAAAREQAESRARMSFEELARSMGYEI